MTIPTSPKPPTINFQAYTYQEMQEYKSKMKLYYKQKKSWLKLMLKLNK